MDAEKLGLPSFSNRKLSRNPQMSHLYVGVLVVIVIALLSVALYRTALRETAGFVRWLDASAAPGSAQRDFAAETLLDP